MQPNRPFKKRYILYLAGVIIMLTFAALSRQEGKKPSLKPLRNVPAASEQSQPADPERETVTADLKKQAERNWPSDYMTQEYWISEQLHAYDQMLTVEDNPIKRQAQDNWPLDFVTQKFWYDEQVSAKERLQH